MKLQEQDVRGALLGPAALAAYLRAAGWRKVDDLVRRGTRTATQFLSPDGSLSVWLPLLPEARDYGRLLAQAINVVAGKEGRTPAMVIDDARMTRTDLVRVRRPERHDHTLPLKHAPALFSGARDLVAASAMAAVDPRPAFPGRRRTDVVKFLDDVMLGQTEPSSYAIRLLLPLPPSMSAQMPLLELDEDLPELELPFARRVSILLAQAVDRAREAATAALVDGTLELFQNAVEAGVSAELCRAIVMLGGDDWGAQVEVSVRYGRAFERRAPTPVVFQGDAFGVLQQAATFLADREPRQDVELEGLVVKLASEGTSSGMERQEGTLWLAALIDGSVKKVKVVVAEPFYSRAVDAHQHERRISIVGTLVREGRGYALNDPQSFAVVKSS